MIALGTIVEAKMTRMAETELYSGLLDYYDDWNKIDHRLIEHYDYLSRAADVFGHDLVNMATYIHEILAWLAPNRIRQGQSVVSVGGMTEAFLVSVRSACDAVAFALAYRACEKPMQAPSNSLRSLVTWAQKNNRRVNPIILKVLASDLEWFWKLRSLRDHIVHSGAHAIIHTDGRQFNLWVYSPPKGWVTREPLLRLLAKKLKQLISFADRSAEAINQVIGFPIDRIKSRVVSGILIPALHTLFEVTGKYAESSP